VGDRVGRRAKAVAARPRSLLIFHPSMREDVAVDAGDGRPARRMLVAFVGRPVVIRRRGRVRSRGGERSTGS
jgi:hypothetical protein